MDGATVRTLVASPFAEYPLDLTVDGTLFVDSDSKIDVSNRGYLGGWSTSADGSRNESDRGMTVGLTNDGGPTGSASHAGRAGVDDLSETNETYGSITSPVLLGTGGGGVLNLRGGNGGGAAIVSAEGAGARLVIAGAVRADGESGKGLYGAGSGGSIQLRGSSVIFGPATADQRERWRRRRGEQHFTRSRRRPDRARRDRTSRCPLVSRLSPLASPPGSRRS